MSLHVRTIEDSHVHCKFVEEEDMDLNLRLAACSMSLCFIWLRRSTGWFGFGGDNSNQAYITTKSRQVQWGLT